MPTEGAQVSRDVILLVLLLSNEAVELDALFGTLTFLQWQLPMDHWYLVRIKPT